MILSGAEINAESEHQTAQDTTEGRRNPMGSRGATMADTIGPEQSLVQRGAFFFRVAIDQPSVRGQIQPSNVHDMFSTERAMNKFHERCPAVVKGCLPWVAFDRPRQPVPSAMTPDLRALGDAYRKAADGDLDKALELAIAELLDARAEADFSAQALDQWVSRGYVQGRASELCLQQSERMRQQCAGVAGVDPAPARKSSR